MSLPTVCNQCCWSRPNLVHSTQPVDRIRSYFILVVFVSCALWRFLSVRLKQREDSLVNSIKAGKAKKTSWGDDHHHSRESELFKATTHGVVEERGRVENNENEEAEEAVQPVFDVARVPNQLQFTCFESSLSLARERCGGSFFGRKERSDALATPSTER